MERCITWSQAPKGEPAYLVRVRNAGPPDHSRVLSAVISKDRAQTHREGENEMQISANGHVMHM